MTRLFLAVMFVLLTLHPVSDGYCHNIKVTNPALGALSGGSTTVTFNVS